MLWLRNLLKNPFVEANGIFLASLSYSATQFNSDSQMQDLTEDLNAGIGISINLKPAKK